VHTRVHTTGSRWHPLLAAVEREPAVWTLVDSAGRDYAIVRLERDAGALGYTAELAGERVGRYASLRAAVEGVHQVWVRSHAPGGAPNGGKGYVLGT
jgi:hypothetical protein